jgi:hypothetical protein
MKELQLTEEDYAFLKECVNELHTQDNRSTRNPFYTVWHEVKEYGLDDNYASEHIYLWEEDEFDSLDDVFKFLDENRYEEELIKMYNESTYSDYVVEMYEGVRGEIKDWFCDSYNEYAVVSAMERLTDGFFSVVGVRSRTEQVVNGACFSFFEKDAFQHIELNGHNITGKRHTYADSLFRTLRMERLLELLKKLEFKE